MPPSVQVQMLRVLEAREVTPLGINAPRPVDLRVIAAAKVDLGDPAERGSFREDLYYRLNVVTVSIPPLRERRDDVPLLFGYFASRAAPALQPRASGTFGRSQPTSRHPFLAGQRPRACRILPSVSCSGSKATRKP